MLRGMDRRNLRRAVRTIWEHCWDLQRSQKRVRAKRDWRWKGRMVQADPEGREREDRWDREEIAGVGAVSAADLGAADTIEDLR